VKALSYHKLIDESRGVKYYFVGPQLYIFAYVDYFTGEPGVWTAIADLTTTEVDYNFYQKTVQISWEEVPEHILYAKVNWNQ
jgi:hypothetical protein